jgi:peptide-O-fucosyltransferase
MLAMLLMAVVVVMLGVQGVNGEWDEHGYIIYCPCMGRFGNQVSHFLGALAFAKDLNRTLTLPPWRTYRNVPFNEWFKPEVVGNYHKSILLEEFLLVYGDRWSERVGYCYKGTEDGGVKDCGMKNGNPFGPFWDELGINFNKSEFTFLSYGTDMEHTRNQWMNKYPPTTHPILSFKGAPAAFPVNKRNLHLQKYLQWSDSIRLAASQYVEGEMGGAKYIGVHMRMGSDWKIACSHGVGQKLFMESQQCLHDRPTDTITEDMCYPSFDRMIGDILSVAMTTGIHNLFIASDSDPDIDALRNRLKMNVFYLNPAIVQVDLAILGMSNHFIGNCVSSFSAFVSRQRNIDNQSTSYWGIDRNSMNDIYRNEL